MTRQRIRIEQAIADAAEEARRTTHTLDALKRREDERIEQEHEAVGVSYDSAGTRSEKASDRLRDRMLKLAKRIDASEDDPDLFMVSGIVVPTLATVSTPERIGRQKRPDTAFRWPNEIVALKSGHHDRSSGSMSNTAKVMQHMFVGGTIRTTGEVREPELADEAMAARDSVIASFDQVDIAMLHFAYVALPDPPQRFRESMVTIGDCLRCYPRVGRTSYPHTPKCAGSEHAIHEPLERKQRGSAMVWAAAIRKGETPPPAVEGNLPALSRAAATWQAITARQAGLLTGSADEDAAMVEQTTKRIARARRELRERLAAVDLGEGRRTRWLVPPQVVRAKRGER
jgi:hypothetical protein